MSLEAETFADLIALTRASTGTRFNSSGVMVTEAADAPRFDHDPGDSNAALGLLLEGQRTNLLTRSQDLSHGDWAKLNATAALNQTDLFGTSNAASRITSANTGGSGQSRLSQAVTISGTNAVLWAVMRAGTHQYVQLGTSGMTTNPIARFGLGTGAVMSGSDSSARILPLGGGRYLCWLLVPVGADPVGNAQINLITAAGSTSITLDGTQTFHVLATGVESGNFPTNYIPTVASQVTRSADVAVMSGADFSDWFNATEGTFVLDCDLLPGARADRVLLDASDGSGNNRITVFENSSSQIVFRVRSGGSDQCSLVAHTVSDYAARLKIAVAFAGDDFAACVNGGSVATDTAGTVPTVDRLHLGCDFSGANQAMAWLGVLDFYPERLSNAELQEKTA